MKIISIQDVIDCNHFLEENKLPYKIHLKDACGKQSCSIESIAEIEETSDQLYSLLNSFFEAKRMQLQYNQDKTIFWVV